MQKLVLTLFSAIVLLNIISCKSQNKAVEAEPLVSDLQGNINYHSNLPFDSALIIPFFISFPELDKYEDDVSAIYMKHKYNHLWFDKKGIVEFSHSLYGKIKALDVEGVSATFPYQQAVDGIFDVTIKNRLSETETEIMLSCLFLFYAEKVYKGVDDKTTSAIGWLLPRKEVSYTVLLDSMLSDPELLNRNEQTLFPQYYKLRNVLQRYRDIEKNGGWKPIFLDPDLKAYNPGDTAIAIRQIRERLFVTGDLKQNTGSNRYDDEMVAAVNKYQARNGKKADPLIKPKLIQEMNTPISRLIKTIMVNMERCRWISPEMFKAGEFIVVNIPSYKLNLYRDGKSEFESPVVVGTSMTKTVIFSGNMSYIVFSPYWNLPQSIINKEVKPGMARNKNYLASHNMEWNNGQVRQKPGKRNSLGLVKFMFPNSHSIYLHDTPSKSLFEKESRAFSHGCVRVGKPRELAISILKDDPNWTPQKIDEAMNAGRERSYTLKNKIPVYIGYFTAWVNTGGEISFFEDVYDRDERLAKIMMD
jgi:murein L,D-transpeptidase YcbB/YkuD